MITAKLPGAVLLLAAGVALAQPAAQDKGLSLDEFTKLHKELQPSKDERWRSIPWKVSILEARDQAAKEKKPIFVWVASGEPLGCG